MVNTSRELKNLQKEDRELKKFEYKKTLRSSASAFHVPNRNLRERKDAVEEGFYDDFPAELIRKFKLKVSKSYKKKLQEEKRKARRNFEVTTEQPSSASVSTPVVVKTRKH